VGTSSAHIEILHDWHSDLLISIGTGDPSSPDLELPLGSGAWGSTGALVLDIDLSGAAAYLPPSPGHPWYLRVIDGFAGDEGDITQFTVTVNGRIYSSTSVPVPILDESVSYAYIRPVSNPAPLNLLLQ
jgi:hypothetical protein